MANPNLFKIEQVALVNNKNAQDAVMQCYEAVLLAEVAASLILDCRSLTTMNKQFGNLPNLFQLLAQSPLLEPIVLRIHCNGKYLSVVGSHLVTTTKESGSPKEWQFHTGGILYHIGSSRFCIVQKDVLVMRAAHSNQQWFHDTSGAEWTIWRSTITNTNCKQVLTAGADALVVLQSPSQDTNKASQQWQFEFV